MGQTGVPWSLHVLCSHSIKIWLPTERRLISKGPSVVALERNVPGGGGLKLTQRTLLPHSIIVLFSSSLFDGRHRKTGRHRRDPPDPGRRRGQPLHRHRLWYAPHPMLPFSLCPQHMLDRPSLLAFRNLPRHVPYLNQDASVRAHAFHFRLTRRPCEHSNVPFSPSLAAPRGPYSAPWNTGSCSGSRRSSLCSAPPASSSALR